MKDAVRVLVVDDEPGMRDMLAYELGGWGYAVSVAPDGPSALALLREGRFSLVVSDIMMPGMDGLELLEAGRGVDPGAEWIMATGFGDVSIAVDAMKRGAYDFIQKPFNLEELRVLIEKALEKRDMRLESALHEAGRVVLSAVRLETLLPAILEQTQRVLRADDVSLMLTDEDGGLSLAASSGIADADLRTARLPLGQRVAGRAAERREPILVSGPLEQDARFAGLKSLRDVKSAIVFPLVLGREVLGVLNANRTRDGAAFTEADLRVCTVFCAHIAQAVYNARLLDRSERQRRDLEKAYAGLEEAKARLVQAEKLAAVGQLAAGVAHELNNPLTGILGFAELLLQDERLSTQQKEDLQVIFNQSRRCRQIIQNLLQFSRQHKAEMAPLDVPALLHATVQLVRYEIQTSGVRFEVDVPDGLPRIRGDAGQLQQVFVNLLTNARHAVEGRAVKEVRLSAAVVGGKVEVSVEDTGPGIPAEHLPRLFDPFFTTKPVGKGTGLGLSISYGIVQQHGGTIDVESRPGAGCRFVVRLPTESR
jgi:signal transduction histidine kinase